MKNTIKAIIICLVFVVSATVSAAERGFAIFIDSESYKQAKAEVDEYAKSVEKQGLKTYIVEDVWYNPDSIRAKVIELATQKKAPVEGVVFIGDIPVVMVRDAQHLTSAFKPKQNEKDMEWTTCPSDRFYDDFSLEFDFIKRDEAKPNLFYYTLTNTSAQVCAPNIYSARIKTCDKGNLTKYDRLKGYLKKVVALKEKNEKFANLFFFAGHGYNSESMVARIDEKSAYLEMFPTLRGPQMGITYQDHTNHTFSKFPLMSNLQRKDLSLSIVHHHGYPDTEYLNGEPVPRSAEANLEAAKSFFRSKIRSAVRKGKSKEEASEYYISKYDIPAHWLDSIFTEKSIREDSLFNDKLDLHLTDFGKYQPNTRIVILDACYNGAFNNDAYIAEEYIFEGGDCAIAIANSVNSLQDKWCDRNIGMFALGMRVGNFVKYNPYFESHIFGDPTFAFAPSFELSFDVNDAIYEKCAKFWKKQLKSDYPAMQSFAINVLARSNQISSDELLEIYKTSPYQTVRLMAFTMLAQYKDDNYVEVLSLGLNDNYEIIRRFASIQAAKSGDLRLIPSLVSLVCKNSVGERVEFQAFRALAMFPEEELVAEFERQQPFKYFYDSEKEAEKMLKHIKRCADKATFDDDLAELQNPETAVKAKKNIIRSFRNRPLHPAVDVLLGVFESETDTSFRVSLAEVMGWFDTSYRRAEIADFFKKVSENDKYDDAVRYEALKTYNRLAK